MTDAEINDWKETVRDIYDMIHMTVNDDTLGQRIVSLIEDRHQYFRNTIDHKDTTHDTIRPTDI